MPTTVFVADDHAIVRDGLIALLSAQTDLEVLGSAGAGREAVTEVLRLQPQVAILDISMPDLDGIEVTRRIHGKLPDVAIVILSMHSSPQHVLHALQAGARGYLLKESASRDIVEAVRAVAAGRRFLSPQAAEILAHGLTSRVDANPLESLSVREREVIKLVADGHSSAQIGRMLHLSPKTVDSYRSRLMQKLGVNDLAGLVKFAIQHGIISLD